MRNVLCICLVLLLAPSASTLAQVTGGDEANSTLATDSQQERLDYLFSELRRSGNEAVARRISQRIRSEWAKSGSATIDLLMQRSNKAIDEKKYDAALDYLDEVVTLLPAYAEGWNLRATAHFSREDLTRAMADIERTLQLEPRHFGALAGMAAILRDTGHEAAAAGVYERLLELYPMMRSAQKELGKLADDMAGQGI